MAIRLTLSTISGQLLWPPPAPQPPTVTLTSQSAPLQPAYLPGSACGYQVIVLDGEHLADEQAVAFDAYFTVPNTRYWFPAYIGMYDDIAAALQPYQSSRYCAALASFGLDSNMYPSPNALEALRGFGAGPGLDQWRENCDPGSEGNTSDTWTHGGAYVMAGFGASSPGDAVEELTWLAPEEPVAVSTEVFFLQQTSDGS